MESLIIIFGAFILIGIGALEIYRALFALKNNKYPWLSGGFILMKKQPGRFWWRVFASFLSALFSFGLILILIISFLYPNHPQQSSNSSSNYSFNMTLSDNQITRFDSNYKEEIMDEHFNSHNNYSSLLMKFLTKQKFLF